MSGWWRMLCWVLLAIMPGGLPLLLAWAAARTVRVRWLQAREQAQAAGVPVSWREVLATVEFKDLMRQVGAVRQAELTSSVPP